MWRGYDTRIEISMGNALDEFVNGLQDRILEETRVEFGDVAFERWQNPLYVGSMENPHGHGRVTGSCGDTMQIFLKFEKNRVKEATFITDGCGSSTVCGSFAAELAIGKTPDEVVAVTGEVILKILGRFPEEYQHCAFLAADTLQDALNDYLIKENRKVR
jgi:nitrogen fixation protein NifU and related proteins